jgi:molybdate transport system substrate-binding protein
MRSAGQALPALVLIALSAWLLACSSGGDDGQGTGGPGTQAAVSRRITVFAAASLSEAFNALAGEFERKYAGTDVEFNFAGTPTLRAQLEQGARADVFASADLAQMDLARQNGVVVDTGKVFARNSLVVITPASNPGNVRELADLRRSGLKLVFANQEVPAGAYARQMLLAMEKEAAYGPGFSEAVLKNVVSLESNVRQVVSKVELGEADAGIVYGTDVTPSLTRQLTTIAVPPQLNVAAEYPIATTKDARNAEGGRAFIDFVLSSAGQSILKRYGFQTVVA